MISPLPAIGVVRTARTELEHTPVQAAANRAEEGTIELDERFAEGLAGLAAFDYAWLLSWLDRPDRPPGEPACWFDAVDVPEGVTPARLAEEPG
jgi:tRNA (Thr-GGU) A37 N-methylase